MDKYLPLQIHREISTLLQFAFAGDKEVSSRLDWFDEVKTPLLTTLMMCDGGTDRLNERA